MSQEMQAASRSWKGKEIDSFLEHPEINSPANTMILAKLRLIWYFWSLETEEIDVY